MSENPSLRELAKDRSEKLRNEANDAGRLAKRHQQLGYVVGAPGAALAVVGGILFAVDDVSTATASIVLVAGVVTALAAYLASNRLATLNLRRRDCLTSLADRMENAIADTMEPTRKELDDFARERADCTAGESSSRR
jgi:hypothetical protein